MNYKFLKIFIVCFYLFCLVFWLSFNIKNIIVTTKIDDGFGPGISAWFLDSYKIRQIILIVQFLLETIFIILAFYYIRFKFSKRKDILNQEYWIDSMKAIYVFLFGSIVVFIMKIIFGRPYFYSVDFEKIFYSDAMKPEWRKYWTSYGHTIKTWGIYNSKSGLVSGVKYLNWWQINDFFNNFRDLFEPTGSGKHGWWNNDFPSGHMNSCFTMIYVFYYFLGKNKNRKANSWKLIGILYDLFI